VSDVVAPYDFARETVDGNDVLAVWERFGAFLEQARAGDGPFLLECLTVRLRGHYEGDPAAYREAIADEEWQTMDPILRLQRHGIEQGWFTAEDCAAIEAEAVEEVEAAVAFGRESAFPPPELVGELVYA
jgi:pyruvate dehydrogenase E1 component alpha subunit